MRQQSHTGKAPHHFRGSRQRGAGPGSDQEPAGADADEQQRRRPDLGNDIQVDRGTGHRKEYDVHRQSAGLDVVVQGVAHLGAVANKHSCRQSHQQRIEGQLPSDFGDDYAKRQNEQRSPAWHIAQEQGQEHAEQKPRKQ